MVLFGGIAGKKTSSTPDVDPERNIGSVELKAEKSTVSTHIPVMADEVLEFLDPKPGCVYLDATLGAGGHSRLLLEAAPPDSRVIAFDRDARAIEAAQINLAELGERVSFHNEDFRRAPDILGEIELDGAVADLGVSSLQFDDPEAGFSFRFSGPLDMRMDKRSERTAAYIVNNFAYDDLAEVLWRYGEERRSRRIARAIVKTRETSPIESTDELARVVRSAFSAREQRTARIDPATRTFQALRIAVNDELDGLDEFISATVLMLKPGARLVIISFHSLEDRIVKATLRNLSGASSGGRYLPPEEPTQPQVRILTRRPVRPSESETERNPRSRSARLRAAERLADGEE